MGNQSSMTDLKKPDLIELLESFNRKERFFLVKHALGNFQLSYDFRKQLGCKIGLKIPHDAFAAMDFHLDWLSAALHVNECGYDNQTFCNPQQRIVEGNQEDIDLLVAFKDGEEHHLVLVEAKGVGSWDNSQMLSKASRLGEIFGDDGECFAGAKPHFSLVSPKLPKKLKTCEWPGWMSKNGVSNIWIKMEFPEGRVRVTRCDAAGNSSKAGSRFMVIPA